MCIACGNDVTSESLPSTTVDDAPLVTAFSENFGSGFRLAHVPSWMCAGRGIAPAPVARISIDSLPGAVSVKVA